jgi:RHS repeat-associated protein
MAVFLIAPAAQAQAAGFATQTSRAELAAVANARADTRPPGGPFVSRPASSAPHMPGVRESDEYAHVRPPSVTAAQHQIFATYAHAQGRGVPVSVPQSATRHTSGTAGAVPGRAPGVRTISSVTLGQTIPTGLNTWWAYEQDQIPGLGRFMVNLGSSRNLMVQADDLGIPHRWIDASLRRTYNSYSQHDYANTDGTVASSFGNGWTNSFDAHLATNSGANGTYGITVYDTDGARYDYTPTDSTGNAFTPPPGQHAMLVPDSTHCTYYWIKKSGTQYHFRTPATAAGQTCAVAARNRATAGRLLHIYGRNSLSQLDFTYAWDAGNQSSQAYLNQILVAADGQNTVATLNFTTVGSSCSPVQSFRLLTSMVDAAGATTYYKYDCSANLVEVDKPNDTSQAVCLSDGTSCVKTKYAYTGAHLMTAASGGRWSASLTDPNNLATGTDGGYVVFNYADSAGSVASAQFVGVVNPQVIDGYSTTVLQPLMPTGVQTFKTDWYDLSGSTTTWHDSDGHQTQYGFDGLGRVVSLAHSTGTTTLTATRAWDADNNLTAETDYRGNTTNFAHDTFGNTTAVAKPSVTVRVNGATQTIRPTSLYTYDSHENIIAHCDETWSALNGGNWNGVGTPATCPTTVGSASNSGPDVSVFSDQTGHGNEPYGELTDSYAANGYHYHYTYSGVSEGGTGGNAGLDFGSASLVQGDPFTSGSTSIAPSQQYVYDAYGNVICSNKGGVGWSEIKYDADGRKLIAADADDDTGLRRTECTKQAGLPGSSIVQTFTYYPSGNVATSQTPSEAATSTTTSFTYDGDGNIRTATHHFGGTQGVTQNWYDGYDRLIEVSQPRDTTDYYSYPWLTRYYYDLTHNGTVSIGTASGLKAYGNQFKSQIYLNPPPTGTDPWTDQKGSTFDAVDRPTAVYEPAVMSASPTVSNTYDQTGTLPGEQARLGFLSHTQNGSGQGADLHYDAIGRATEKDYSDGTPQLKVTFDPEGRVADRYSSASGDEVTSFDALGNPASVTTPPVGAETASTTVNYQYTPNGWRSATGVVGAGMNTSSLMTYAYRADGKLVEQDVNLNGHLNQFSFTFTPAGRRQTMTDPATGGLVPAAAARSAQSAAKAAETANAPSKSVAKYAAVVGAPKDLLGTLGIERDGERPGSTRVSLMHVLAPAVSAATASGTGSSYAQPRAPRAAVRPFDAHPRAKVKDSVVPTKAHALAASRYIRKASSAQFVPTRFDYDSYGRLTTETLPTGYQYTGITYDPEAQVTSFSAYGDPTNLSQIPTQLVKNAFTVRGELQGQHYYPNGGATYTDTWPHFSSQNADGYSLPASENVAQGQTLYTSYYASDDRSNENWTTNSQNQLLQAYGWQIDAAGRQTIGRWEGASGPPGSYIYGAEQRVWDAESRLLSWNILSVDPDKPSTPLSGWPVQGADVNLKCAGPAPGTLSLYAPGTSITYVYGPNGKIAGNSVHNVGQAAVSEQLHYDGDSVLFTTDNTGQVDNVRVGISAIVLPDGRATMLDRDWNGAWVLTHSSTGYSYWEPPDPNLQNCQPQNPPVGSTNYQPAGLPMQFANLTADTLTDGYNFFAGARTYDPLISEWTSPDPSGGTRADPISQMPYIWNRSNPVTYQDPTGYCADPGGKGTRVCVDFYIPTWLFGGGDDRGPQNFASRDQDRYRVRVNVDFDDRKVTFDVSPTHFLGQEFSTTPGPNKYQFFGNRDVEVTVDDSSGLFQRLGADSLSAITGHFWLHLNDDGTVSYRGTRSMYPAVEGYAYSSKGVRLLFTGDALGPPAVGTIRGLPPVPLDFQLGKLFSAIDASEIPSDDFVDDFGWWS